MCSPMTPCGPDSVVMKPIFTVSAAAGATARRHATNATDMARILVYTVTSSDEGNIAKNGVILARRWYSARPAVGLPVEAFPERVDAVDDAVALVAAVGVGAPHVVERAELGEIADPVLRRLGHRHLVGHE